MKFSSEPTDHKRFYILDLANRPVEVFDRTAWSRWMAENDLVFRRTLLDESGVTVTTRFCGVSKESAGDAFVFVTRVAGMKAEGNTSYAARTLDEALDQHERIVQTMLRMLTAR